MKKLLTCFVLLWASMANAADNAVTLTTGSGVTMRTIDIGAGVQSSVVILGSSAGAAIYGTAGTANANVLSVQGIASGTALIVGGNAASGAADSGNPVKVGCKYNVAILALTDGNRADCQADSGANAKVSFGLTSVTLSGWTSGTALNATQVLMVNHGAPAILVQLNQTSTISAGATTIEGTYDGTNWVTVPVAQILNPNTLAVLTNPYTLVQSTNQPFLVLTQGYQSVRLKLSTQITGSATVTPFVTLLNYNPVVGALLNPLSAGSAIIGKVGVDQTTPGTTNGVAIVGVNAATALAGNGVTGTGSQRVTIASDNTPYPIKIDQTTPGSTNSVSFGTDPCSFLAKINLAIDQAADTQVISGTSSKKTYICSFSVIAAAAETVSLVAGTGTVCATGIAALIGSTTDANGLSFAVNGGLTLGSGVATIASGVTNADNICIRQGGTSRLAGNLTYVQN